MERRRPSALIINIPSAPYSDKRSMYPLHETITDTDIKLAQSFHPNVHCTPQKLSEFLSKNVATDDTESSVYQTNIEIHKDLILKNTGSSFEDIMKLMNKYNVPEGSYYYLYSSFDKLSEKMPKNTMVLIFIIKINGTPQFSFCEQWIFV